RDAVAVAEVPVVVDQHVEAVRGEHLGEAVQVHLLDGREAVGNDNGGSRSRAAFGQVEPAAQGDTRGLEFNVSAGHWVAPSGRGPGHGASATPGRCALKRIVA